MAIKVGFQYLKTTVASYELRTPGHMNGNEASSNEYCLFIPLSCDPLYLSANFQFFAFFSKNKLSRVLKKVGITSQVEKFDDESF